MKAEFRKTRYADGLPLTFGKMYDVIDIVAGSRIGQVKKIKIKNDLGKECWYAASRFKLFMEVSAYLKEPTAAGAGQDAAKSATPDGSEVYIGIDIAHRADMTAGLTAKQTAEEIGKQVAKGLMNGIGLNYGA